MLIINGLTACFLPRDFAVRAPYAAAVETSDGRPGVLPLTRQPTIARNHPFGHPDTVVDFRKAGICPARSFLDAADPHVELVRRNCPTISNLTGCTAVRNLASSYDLRLAPVALQMAVEHDPRRTKRGLFCRRRNPMTRPGLAACLLLMLSGVTAAMAETYPIRPISIIVPFAAGGPADTLSRMLGQRLQSSLGQPIVVENVTGAAGSLGVGRVVRAAPDGYTIGIGHLGTHVFNGALYDLPYDLVKDLEPISLLPANVSVLITKKDVSATDFPGLIAWLKANPDQATAATAGIGSVAHVASTYFQKAAGVALTIVPYRSGAAANADVIAGHVTLLFDQVTGGSVQLYRGGAVRPFAVAAKARLASMPDIPTVDEAGLPGLYVSTWYGLWAPKGTPRDIVGKLNAAITAALAEPELRRQLAEQEAQLPDRDQQSPEALGAFQKAEIDKWWPIIKAANIKVE
jgi:tripartite-type tricarboxylate transporter receptor subunit TctC